jgi:nucleoside phosphorylase
LPRPIAMIVAFPEEIAPFLKYLQVTQKKKINGFVIYETTYYKHNIVIAISGMGKQNAEKTARYVMNEYTPQGLLSVGFSAATLHGIKTGVVILPEQILDINSDGKIISNIQIEQDWWKNQLWDAINFSGISLCVDKVITTGSLKQEMGKLYHAVIMDMESAAVAKMAEQARIPFCAIRVVSDTAEEDLPVDFNLFTDDKNNIQKSKIIYYLLLHPLKIVLFLNLMKKTKAAANHLSGFLYLLFGKK